MNFGANQMEDVLFCSDVQSGAPRTGASKTEQKEEVVRQCDVTVHDVLLGRGRGPNMHPGNQRYREIIYANRENYNKASNRTEQTRITREIVNHIKQNGRFLKRLEVPKSQKKKKKRGESNTDSWVVVSDATARLKVGQCLRYKLRQDAEQHDDGSLADEGFGEESHSGSTEKYSGGAVIPPVDMPPANTVEAEPILSGQPSRKYRKVEVPEEPALDAEEMQVLKSFNRSSHIPDEENDSLDGFVDSPLWEAKADSHVLPVEEQPELELSASGSYYDSMFGYGDTYDSNFAYGNELISDAEVLTALGYPQAPAPPSKRPPVICYCGRRLKSSEAHKHQCGARQGIFAMPGASPSGSMAAASLSQPDALMSEPQEEPICGIVGGANDNNMVNGNTNFSSMMTPPTNNGMTPMVSGSGWDVAMQSSSMMEPTPIQSVPMQSAPPRGMSVPFQVPDAAPMARPRMYRPFMQNIS